MCLLKASETAWKKLHVIRSTLSIDQLLMVGMVPIEIPTDVIDTIKQLEANQQGEIQSHFKAGDAITIRSEIYQNLKNIYQMTKGLVCAVILIYFIFKKDTSPPPQALVELISGNLL